MLLELRQKFSISRDKRNNVRDIRAAGDVEFVGADTMATAIRGDLIGPCPSGFVIIALLCSTDSVKDFGNL